ncbi:MAG: glycoside hydrolase family 97 protein [Cyclobacteriaceae bacterium]
MLFTSCQEHGQLKVNSPDQLIEMQLINAAGKVGYTVKYKDKVQIDTSFFGFDFKNQTPLSSNLKIESTQNNFFSEIWEMPWGEQREVLNEYNELIATVVEDKEPRRTFDIHFKAYNDGVGFRFEFPDQKNLKDVTILDEHTEFNLTSDPTVWWIPGDWDIYEYLYQKTRLSEIDALKLYQPSSHLGQTYVPENAVNTPVTMKTDQGVYMSFHEADLTDYAGMTLKVDTANLRMKSELVGNATGEKVIQKTPFVTPWRTIQIADRAGDLIESNLIVNLNEENTIGDISYFKPMKYMGIWWDMHIGTGNWDYAGENHAANTTYAKELIDFASDNNIQGLLIEGWNIGWEHWWDKSKKQVHFDFVTPYPDYDLEEVVKYGKDKGVELVMHHETSADITLYESKMDTAFKLMKSLDIHSVKTGYVGSLIPEGEYHHGQWMVNHYQKVLDYGAKYQVAINAHEPIKPTGKRRTYPVAISREGLRGQEYNAWSNDGGNPPNHIANVAFTRMLAGPVDFTPGAFNIKLDGYKEHNQINTTLAHQLALYVVLYSPIQMACDLIQHYEDQPAFQFIKDVAVDWEQTKVLDGEVGDFVVIGRQERGGQDWFVGGVIDENVMLYHLDLKFLDSKKFYIAKIYKDNNQSHWKLNPTAIDIEEREVSATDVLDLIMKPGGGFAISLEAKK